MIRDKLFRKVTGISDEDVIVELEKMASVQSLRKGEMYIHRGEPEMQVAFLLSGGIKTFLIQDNGSMYVNCLEARRYAPLLTNGSGPHAPALMNIQTIADTEILKVPMDLVWRLREENLGAPRYKYFGLHSCFCCQHNKSSSKSILRGSPAFLSPAYS